MRNCHLLHMPVFFMVTANQCTVMWFGNKWYVRNDIINLSRAWEKEKNRSCRQELNLWPSIHWLDVLTTELQRTCDKLGHIHSTCLGSNLLLCLLSLDKQLSLTMALVTQTLVVQTLDGAIYWIKCYPVDQYKGNQLRYPVDNVIHPLNNSWALASVVQTLDSAIHRINHYPADKY